MGLDASLHASSQSEHVGHSAFGDTVLSQPVASASLEDRGFQRSKPVQKVRVHDPTVPASEQDSGPVVELSRR